MTDNSTAFALSSFTSVLAGGGTIAGVFAVLAAAAAIVYALCCRRGRVSITRAGVSIEPSPPRSGSAESATSSLPPAQLRLAETAQSTTPPIVQLPKRETSRKTKKAAAPSAEASEAAEVQVSASH